MVGLLTLPEEFALLSLADTGKMIDSGQAKGGCAVAELGELALRGRLLVRQGERKVWGRNWITQVTQAIELVDPAPVGLVWADEILAELATATRPVGPRIYLSLRHRRRRNAFHWHRDALVTRGLVRYVPSRGLFRRARYLPDSTIRNRLIDELRLAAEVAQGTIEGRLDVHTKFLSDMVIRGELAKDLGVVKDRGWHLNVMFLNGLLNRELRFKGRRARDRAREAVESIPEPLRHTSEVLAERVPKRSRHQGDADDGD